MLRRLFPNIAYAIETMTLLDWRCLTLGLIMFAAPASIIVRGLLGLPTIPD
jgi:hypothetical protein